MDTEKLSKLSIKEPIIRRVCDEIIQTPLKPVKDLSWLYNDDDNNNKHSTNSGLFCDSSGNLIGGVFTSLEEEPQPQEQTKDAIATYEIARTLVISKGHLQTAHMYPHLDLPFTSAMHNWNNIFHTPGVSVEGPNNGQILSDGTHCLNAVVNKTKPLGFTPIISDNKEIDTVLAMAKASGLPHVVRYHHSRDGRCIVCMCQTGTLGDLFDMKAWIKSFIVVSEATGRELFTPAEQKHLAALSKKPLSDWLYTTTERPPLANPQLAIFGLILGYPLQATISEMMNAK